MVSYKDKQVVNTGRPILAAAITFSPAGGEEEEFNILQSRQHGKISAPDGSGERAENRYVIQSPCAWGTDPHMHLHVWRMLSSMISVVFTANTCRTRHAIPGDKTLPFLGHGLQLLLFPW